METKTVTNEFTLTKYSIEYDGEHDDEYIHGLFVETYGEFIEIQEVLHVDEIGFEVVEKEATELKLHPDFGETIKINKDIVEKIKPVQENEYIAVATVPVIHEKVGFFTKKDSYKIDESKEDLSCTVWDKVEYEASNKSNNTE